MYEGTNGERYTIYASKLPMPQTALHYNTMERITAAQWVESEVGYVVSGPGERNRIGKIAQAVYEQMEQRAPDRERTDADQVISRRGS
jgi:anti-sigma factor RsiW